MPSILVYTTHKAASMLLHRLQIEVHKELEIPTTPRTIRQALIRNTQ